MNDGSFMAILFVIFMFTGFGVVIGILIYSIRLELRKAGIKITEIPLVRFSCWVIGFILVILFLLFMFIIIG